MFDVMELLRYPVKSMAPVSVASAATERRGFRGDRRWMLVDQVSGLFLTGRRYPQLVRISLEEEQQGIVLRLGADTLRVPRPDAMSTIVTVRVWKDTCEASDAGDDAAEWLSERIGHSVRLVYQRDDQHRWLSPERRYADGDEVSWADGYPLLLIGSGSLADLNERLDMPVSMRHFRPNIVARVAQPFLEDEWQMIRIGEATFRVGSPCARCIFTTVDPGSGIRDANREPLETLRSYRKMDETQKIYFGVNLIPVVTGRVNVGDQIEVID
ncbi:MAG: MOSC N-terminal beta barrel domain-containing protein [Pseudomonadota bacterium]